MKKFFQKLFKTKEFRTQEAIDRIKYHMNLNKMEIESLEHELKVLENRLRQIKNLKEWQKK